MKLPFRAGVLSCLLGVFAIVPPAQAASIERWPVGGDAATTDTLRTVLGMDAGQIVVASNAPVYPDVRHAVEFTTTDGVVIRGTYAHTPVRTNAPVVLLLHMTGSSRAEFDDFAGFLLRNGYSTLTIDFRGYGESTKFTDGKPILAKDFVNDPKTDRFREMVLDVHGALEWLEKEKLVDDAGIYVLGSHMGGSVASVALPKFGAQIRAALLLSAQIDYRGLDAMGALRTIQGRSILALSSSTDSSAISSLERLNQTNPNFVPKMISGEGQGKALLPREDVRAMTLEFFRRQDQKYGVR